MNVLPLCLGLLTSYFGSCTCTSSAQSPEDAKFEPTTRNVNVFRSDEQEILLSELIQRFSSVLSLATDGDLYREIHNEFTNLLEEYVARNPPCSHVSRLLHAAILGVFRLHNGAIKDSLASNAALQVNRSTIADYAHWSLDIVNILLSQTVSNDRDGSIERLQLRHEMTSRLLPYGKKSRSHVEYSNLQGMAQPQPWSSYYYKLDAKLKARYLEKVSLIKQEDPYALKKADFCRDTTHLPSLG